MTMNCKHGLSQAMCAMCNPSKDIQFSLTNFARRFNDLSSKELADKALEKMTTNQQHRLLLSLLRNQFDNIKRAGARTVEIASSPYELERRERQKAQQVTNRAMAAESRIFGEEYPWKIGYGKAHEDWIKTNPINRKLRLQRTDPVFLEFMESRGITDYLYNYNSYNIEKAFKDFENNVRQAVTLELTEELLNSSFVVDDRVTTWGEATVPDHEARISFLLAQAGGTVDTAKRHKAAVEMLVSRHKEKLNEVANG